jgi:hypothetical protein
MLGVFKSSSSVNPGTLWRDGTRQGNQRQTAVTEPRSYPRITKSRIFAKEHGGGDDGYVLWRHYTPKRLPASRPAPSTSRTSDRFATAFQRFRPPSPRACSSEFQGRSLRTETGHTGLTSNLTTLERWRSCIRSLAKLCGNPPAAQHAENTEDTWRVVSGIKSALSFALNCEVNIHLHDSSLINSLSQMAKNNLLPTQRDAQTLALIQTDTGRVYARVVGTYDNGGQGEKTDARWLGIACAQAASAFESAIFREESRRAMAEQNLERLVQISLHVLRIRYLYQQQNL